MEADAVADGGGQEPGQQTFAGSGASTEGEAEGGEGQERQHGTAQRGEREPQQEPRHGGEQETVASPARVRAGRHDSWTSRPSSADRYAPSMRPINVICPSWSGASASPVMTLTKWSI